MKYSAKEPASALGRGAAWRAWLEAAATAPQLARALRALDSAIQARFVAVLNARCRISCEVQKGGRPHRRAVVHDRMQPGSQSLPWALLSAPASACLQGEEEPL